MESEQVPECLGFTIRNRRATPGLLCRLGLHRYTSMVSDTHPLFAGGTVDLSKTVMLGDTTKYGWFSHAVTFCSRCGKPKGYHAESPQGIPIGVA